MSVFSKLPPAIKIATREDAEALCRHLAACPLLAFDTETTGLSRQSCYALILSLSDGIGRWAIWPDALPYFKELLENPRVRLIGHNANFDQWMLLNTGIDLNRLCPRGHARVIDTMVMHALLDDAAPHDLKYLSRCYLGIEMVPFKQVYGVQMRTRSLLQILLDPANEEVTVNYSALDAYATYRLFKILQLELERATCEGPYANLWDYYLRSEVLYTKVLWEMEREGIALNREALLSRAPDIELELMQLVGWFCKQERRFDVNLNSIPQMSRLFFTKLGYSPLTYTAEGAPQLSKPALKMWAKQGCEFATRLLRYRDLSKQLTTYVVGLTNKVCADGKVHATFVQTGARCLPRGELVLTHRGYLPVEQARVGDWVIAHTGIPRRVTECSAHAAQPIYHVHLNNGLVLRTTGNHEYRTGDTWTRADHLEVGQSVSVHADAEEWRSIEGWEPFEVSSWGRVRNHTTGVVRRLSQKGRHGHLKVTLYRNGAQARGRDKRDFSVHRLVLTAFVGVSAQEVRHLNGIAWDNILRNLAYGSAHENRQDALRHGTMSQRRAGRTILTEQDVSAIRAVPRIGQHGSPTAKLTYVIAEQIRASASGAYGEAAALARQYGVHVASMHRLLRGETWVRATPLTAQSDEDLARQYGISREHMRDIRTGKKWQAEDYIEGVVASFHEAFVVAVLVAAPAVSFGLSVEVDHSHVTGGVSTHNTGRLAARDPNLQNQPPWVRAFYEAEDGTFLRAADYAQLEMRILAHLTGAKALIEAINAGKDVHSATAANMYRVPYDAIMDARTKHDAKEEVTVDEAALLKMRAAAKTLQFGLVYGMGPSKLARELGITGPEAKEVIQQYFAVMPEVQEYFERTIGAARRNGFCSTLMGRRRQVRQIWSPLSGEVARAERQVKNAPIQGLASEITKLAMLAVYQDEYIAQTGTRMLIQVHDEIVFKIPLAYQGDQQLYRAISDHMSNAVVRVLGYPLKVALDTSGAEGTTWLACK